MLDRKSTVISFALITPFWQFLVNARAKEACLENAWRLYRLLAARDKVNKPTCSLWAQQLFAWKQCLRFSCLHDLRLVVVRESLQPSLKIFHCSHLFRVTEHDYKPERKRFKILLTASEQRKLCVVSMFCEKVFCFCDRPASPKMHGQYPEDRAAGGGLIRLVLWALYVRKVKNNACKTQGTTPQLKGCEPLMLRRWRWP